VVEVRVCDKNIPYLPLGFLVEYSGQAPGVKQNLAVKQKTRGVVARQLSPGTPEHCYLQFRSPFLKPL
jgi:hypothetical protein